MGDAEALRLLAESTAVASFIPALGAVLRNAADQLEAQDLVILSQAEEIARLEAAARGNGS